MILFFTLWIQVLICRNYMGNMDMNEIDHFMPILMKREEEAEMTPMVSHGSSHFLWIKHSNLYCIQLSFHLNNVLRFACWENEPLLHFITSNWAQIHCDVYALYILFS